MSADAVFLGEVRTFEALSRSCEAGKSDGDGQPSCKLMWPVMAVQDAERIKYAGARKALDVVK